MLNKEKGFTLIEIMIALVVLGAIAIYQIRLMDIKAQRLRIEAFVGDIGKVSVAANLYYLNYCGAQQFFQPNINILNNEGFFTQHYTLPPYIEEMGLLIKNPNTPRAQLVVEVELSDRAFASRIAKNLSTAELVSEHQVVIFYNLKTTNNNSAVNRHIEDGLLGFKSCY